MYSHCTGKIQIRYKKKRFTATPNSTGYVAHMVMTQSPCLWLLEAAMSIAPCKSERLRYKYTRLILLNSPPPKALMVVLQEISSGHQNH